MGMPMLCFLLTTVLLICGGGVVRADMAKDRDECATQLVGLATCLPYVSGTAKAPTLDCCTGLKEVLSKSRKCLCILVKDRNDPSLGLQINATLALGLPQTCKVPANVSECPALLHLAPNSPDAKVFEQFSGSSSKGTVPAPASTEKGNSTSPSATGAQEKSGGQRSKSWFGLDKVVLVLLWCSAPLVVMGV
ncbi:hypothetical protein Scep_013814 [Stephania cephalantha]|uniref:Bifunctional inhibitor/plant lipid transfer protein/seed storage helical domain-containing protein n=1 Tax=Stephania cephalantha TaxID=152367 RepID=A0AAP0J1Y1_9MAGN